MDKELYKIAAQAVIDCYANPQYDLGTTEFSITMEEWRGKPINVLAIAGTNEWGDWFKNLDMRSTRGWKKSSYDSFVAIAREQTVRKVLPYTSKLPLVIAGHSKSGPVAMYIKWYLTTGNTYSPDNDIHCVVFEPARGLRNNEEATIENTTMFIDPDDIVPKLGWCRFKHPECNVIEMKDDHWLPSVKDHGMEHCLEFVNNMNGPLPQNMAQEYRFNDPDILASVKYDGPKSDLTRSEFCLRTENADWDEVDMHFDGDIFQRLLHGDITITKAFSTQISRNISMEAREFAECRHSFQRNGVCINCGKQVHSTNGENMKP